MRNTSSSLTPNSSPRCEFLRRRLAMAIISGDDKTAQRLSILLDQALNGPRAGVRPPDNDDAA